MWIIVWPTMDAFVRRLSKPESDNESSATASASPYESCAEHASKRRRIDVVKNSESEDSDLNHEGYNDHSFADASYKLSVPGSETVPDHTTDFENALPPTQTDEDAIEEYEQFKSSQAAPEDEKSPEKPNFTWLKNRSSIYVDAFNLALDTVLEEETKLFTAKELEVFERWKDLSYEAQYL